MMKLNILILNYNGKDLLEECLPSVVDAANHSAIQCSVTVVDNMSSDGSLDLVRGSFPSVRVFSAAANKVLCSYNEILDRIDDDLILMLNNDIKVDKDFIDPLVETFKVHDDAFLVGPKCLDFDGRLYEGTRAKPFFRMGMFTAISRYPGYEKDIDVPGLTMQSPFGVFDRRKMIELGGFDEMYLPGMMEEADLCYRAYKKGWRCYYEPRSVVYHKGQVTFKKYYTDKKALSIAHRNSFLFIWKNIKDRPLLLVHFLLIPPRLVLSLLRGKTEILRGFREAVSMALKKRRKWSDPSFQKTDREVLREVRRYLVTGSYGLDDPRAGS
jgi:N-acetylglucosaminyl-diphospho-decaprenol L-rhamnosyltransferase